jgi:RimJ/RimL family protein N-acetyltransferase
MRATMGWRVFSSKKPGETDRFLGQLRSVSEPRLKEREAILFTLIHKADQQPIGYTAIKGIDREASHGEVAIAIMEKEYRGHGYGTEAMKLLLSYALETIGLSTLYLTVFSQNKGTIRVYEKLGFVTTEMIEKSWELDSGERVDMIVMKTER